MESEPPRGSPLEAKPPATGNLLTSFNILAILSSDPFWPNGKLGGGAARSSGEREKRWFF